MAEAIMFYIFGGLAVLFAAGVVFFRNPMISAVNMIGVMIMLAALFLMLDAHFLGIIQILVYAGAIIVLFLFVIQLLNQRDEDRAFTPKPLLMYSAVVSAVLLGAISTFTAIYYTPQTTKSPGRLFGTLESVGQLLFKDYMLPFELASILLLSAIVGAVVIAKRKV